MKFLNSLSLIVSTLLAIGLALSLFHDVHPIIGALVLLPLLMMLVAFMFAGDRIAELIMVVDIAGPVQQEGESQRRFQLRLAFWWAIAGATLPASILLLDYSTRNGHILGSGEAILALPLPVFGVSCLLMALKSLFKAFWGKSNES
ncbi:MAG: hypothetical protein AAF358_26400 [Pseudomonadota bacterium]